MLLELRASSLILKRYYSPSLSKGKIEKIHARQIFDSRGNPTIEVDVKTESGLFRAAVPSGSSTGQYEAVEMRDSNPSDYHGKGVTKAVEKVNGCIGPMIIKKGFLATQQKEIDCCMKELDGTTNKSSLGANSMLGVSLAVCRAGAGAKKLPLFKYIAELAGIPELILPVPSMNIINGGVHSGNKLAMQEFMIMPTGAKCFLDALKMGSEVYHFLKDILQKKYGKIATMVGDEGGFAPDISDAKEALTLIQEAIAKANYCGKIQITMDPAASEFHKEGKYNLDKDSSKPDEKKLLDSDKLIKVYLDLIDEFPIVSIEDPFDQDDFQAWKKFTKSTEIQVVGDDLTVTNIKRIERAHRENAANALLLKVNQIGTVTESIEAHQLARKYCWGTMVSHRSGETCDNFIADLVVGLSAGQIKSGAPCRSERLSKYNQLLRIEEELGYNAKFAGEHYRKPWVI